MAKAELEMILDLDHVPFMDIIEHIKEQVDNEHWTSELIRLADYIDKKRSYEEIKELHTEINRKNEEIDELKRTIRELGSMLPDEIRKENAWLKTLLRKNGTPV